MVSISIDENVSHWKTAMEQEKMNWRQYLLPSDSISTIYARYNFNAIPLLVFIDVQGKELKRFQGFSEKNIDLYREFIRGNL